MKPLPSLSLTWTPRTTFLVSVLCCVYIGIGALLFIFQNNFLFPADKTAFDICPALDKAEIIKSGDLRAYFVKRSQEKVVVYYHGNAGRACDRYYMEQYFEPLGYSVMYVEYPGYAEERETTMDKILNEVTIVNAYLKEKSFKEIIVIGESVGTGPAAYQASLSDSNITKLILITPYNNMASVAAFHYPWYPMRILLRNNFTPDVWLKDTPVTTTLILAENDEVVGFKQGMKLADAIPEAIKTVHIVKGAGHNSIYDMQEFSSLSSELIK